MISNVESLSEMILLLGGLARATAAAAKVNAATKNRAVSVFKIHKLTAMCISATEIGGGRLLTHRFSTDTSDKMRFWRDPNAGPVQFQDSCKNPARLNRSRGKT